MPDASKQTIKLFYCYAREDRDLRDQFEKSLSGLKRHYHMGHWYDREILAGQDWEEVIAEQLNSADIIFLLISNDFMASDYCYGIEMQCALQRHAEGSCLVIPILLRPTHWEGEPFGKHQLLPTDARPITRWPNLDDAFLDVVKEVSRAIKSLPIHKSKEEWLEEGCAHRQANNFSEAITAYNKAIKRDANYALAYQQRGEVYYRLNQFSEALADFEHAVSLAPALLCTYTRSGDTLMRLNQTQNAYVAYARSLVVAQNTPQEQWNANFYFYRGEAFLGLKLYSEALTDYEQAIRLDPNDAYAYSSKGSALNNLMRPEEALAAYDQAIRLDPNFVFAYNGKGHALYDLGRHEEALAAYVQAIRLDPNFVFAYNGKGNALDGLRRHEEALAAYIQAIRLDPNDTYAYSGKGNALNGLGRHEEALAAYEQAIRLDRNNQYAYNGKGNALHNLKRYEEANRAKEKARQLGYGS